MFKFSIAKDQLYDLYIGEIYHGETSTNKQDKFSAYTTAYYNVVAEIYKALEINTSEYRESDRYQRI